MDETCPARPTDTERWQQYYAATGNRPPRPLLARAAALLPGGGDALDLGCGAGNDTRYLLTLGFRVTAVDLQEQALNGLQPLAGPALRLAHSSFADFTFESYDLINAQLALPFTPPATFASVFSRLRNALRPGGLFTGHLFGVRDDWNQPGTDMTFHTRSEVESLLDGLSLIELRESEEPARLASGATKQGHLFEIIARQPGS